MKFIDSKEANKYLSSIGMQIGSWNQISDVDCEVNKWINYLAPKNSSELLNFSYHMAGWLPKGDWKIFQIDNSTCLDAVQLSFVEGLLFGSAKGEKLNNNRTILFKFGIDENGNKENELLIANLIYVFSLFECHAYLVSSNSREGERLAVQDGFAYFSASEKNIHGAKALLENFSKKPLKFPNWIMEIIDDG